MAQKREEKILSVTNLQVSFGGIRALDGVDFSILEGSISALIGPNGAGKTTVFNCLTGFYRPSGGSINFKNSQGHSLNLAALFGSLPFSWNRDQLSTYFKYLPNKFFGGTHLVTRAGIGRTFQNIRLFKELSVTENLLIAMHRDFRGTLIKGLFFPKIYQQNEKKQLSKAKYWLERVGLLSLANERAGDLPYGLQRKLEIARTMCVNPRLICLDEPAAGLNPAETEELSSLILSLKEIDKVTVLLIEHDMSLVMNICEQIVVLNYGQVIAKGTPEEIKNNPKVISAYLGTENV